MREAAVVTRALAVQSPVEAEWVPLTAQAQVVVVAASVAYLVEEAAASEEVLVEEVVLEVHLVEAVVPQEVEEDRQL